MNKNAKKVTEKSLVARVMTETVSDLVGGASMMVTVQVIDSLLPGPAKPVVKVAQAIGAVGIGYVVRDHVGAAIEERMESISTVALTLKGTMNSIKDMEPVVEM